MKKIILLLSTLLIPLSLFADSSERIRKEIFDRIKKEPTFGAYDLDIDVSGGVVTMRGNVSSEKSRIRLTEFAEISAGVTKINNYVAVNGRNSIPQGSHVAADANTIPALIISRVRETMQKENFTLNVSQQGNQILLNGTVATNEAAVKIVRTAQDVAPKSIIRNQLVVSEAIVTDSEIKERVLSALKSEPLIKTDDLQISVNNGIVTIGAERPNHREVDRILSVIVMVDGVKDVKSNFIIR